MGARLRAGRCRGPGWSRRAGIVADGDHQLKLVANLRPAEAGYCSWVVGNLVEWVAMARGNGVMQLGSVNNMYSNNKPALGQSGA